MKYLIIDFETGSKEVFGRTANPWYNELVAFCIKTEDVDFYTQYVRDPEEAKTEIVSFIQNEEVMVAHNAKFEMLYIWDSEELQDWLKQGGKIYCTQLAEYYLSSFQEQYAGLRDIAVRKYRLPEREKRQEKYWGAGIDTGDIPEADVLYDVENDVKDTYHIFLEQQKEVTKRGQIFRNMLEIQNDFLLATTECECNGTYIDQEVLQKNKKALEEELKEIEEDLQSMIQKYWRINVN